MRGYRPHRYPLTRIFVAYATHVPSWRPWASHSAGGGTVTRTTVAARLTRGEAWAQDEKDGRPVTTVRALYERFRQIIHEFAKFGVIGVIGLLITNVGYAVLHGIGPVKATTIATILATCVTYVGNR
jgi:hypothetical protein